MGQYGSTSLQERIARRRKRDRAKKIKIFAVVLVVILAIVAGVFWFVNRDNDVASDVDNEIVVDNTEQETDAVEQAQQEEKDEEKPLQEPVDEPKEAGEETSNTEKEVGIEGMLKNGSEELVVFLSSRAAAMIKNGQNTLENTANSGEVDPSKPMIALTFDDGPHAKNTMRILDALEKVGGRATFFVLGELIDGKSDVLKRASDMGCEIGNHSFDHSNFTKISADKMKEQLSKTSNLVKAATGKGTTLTRIPYGSVNDTIRSVVGTPMIGWSLDTRDWESRNADKVVDKVLKDVKDGDIIIMHDIYSSTADAVERIIPELRKKGYQLVTVSELMEARGIKMVNGRVFNVGIKKN